MLVTLLSVLTFAAIGYVVFTLIMGAKSMGAKRAASKNPAGSGAEDKSAAAASNVWMQRRVLGQLAALCLLFITVTVKKNGG